jgi:uncharacterized protein YecE (DUF72 family)
VSAHADAGEHDPGTDAARSRADAAAPPPLWAAAASAPDARPATDGRVLVGTAGWTDRTLTARGVFYPSTAATPEARLRYYASRFPMVEVDATYYALPARQMAQYWIERTPPDFVFDIKAFALMTGHPADTKRLPSDLRAALPRATAAKARVYPKDVPSELLDAVWTTFREAIEPLHAAGKLGAVLLQYPRWFLPNAETKDAILDARTRLGGLPCAIELRNRRWFTEHTAERTLRFLGDHDLPYVVVDEPQGLASSVPPVAAVTSSALAIVRMHGQRGDLWEKPGVSTVERYRYLYDRRELMEWVPRVLALAGKATATHVVFNNCYANYGTTNAQEMMGLLSDAA